MTDIQAVAAGIQHGRAAFEALPLKELARTIDEESLAGVAETIRSLLGALSVGSEKNNEAVGLTRASTAGAHEGCTTFYRVAVGSSNPEIHNLTMYGKEVLTGSFIELAHERMENETNLAVAGLQAVLENLERHESHRQHAAELVEKTIVAQQAVIESADTYIENITTGQ